MRKYLLVIVPVVLFLAGCLGDTIDGPHIEPRSIFPPLQLYYTCFNNSGSQDLQIRWNPPIVDTQKNFKGYFVTLYQSQPFFSPGSDGLDSTYDTIVSVHVPKTDTMYTFINNPKVVIGGRYTVLIWGEQKTDTSVKNDSMILSQGKAGVSFNYDSRPVSAPTAIYASSNGQSGVNLFWSKSAWENNIGAYGYIIRYIDPDNKAAKLTYLTRMTAIDSSKVIRGNWRTQVTTIPNITTPVERRYQFWIKAIRKDSVESADSIGIIWSGAENIPPNAIPVKLDTALFFGQVGFGYNMTEVAPGDPNNAYIQVTQSGGNIVLIAKNSTQFSSKIDQDSGLTFNRNFFPFPLAGSDFNQSQVSFPAVGKINNEGTMVYALFPGGSRARILLVSSQDTVAHTSSYIRPDNTVLIQSSFQPIEPIQLPFF